MSNMTKYRKIEHSSESLSNNLLMLNLFTKLIDNPTSWLFCQRKVHLIATLTKHGWRTRLGPQSFSNFEQSKEVVEGRFCDRLRWMC